MLGSVILQALAVHAAAQSSEGHSVDPTLAWTRAGIVGMWSVCIVSAGIINFEPVSYTHLAVAIVVSLTPYFPAISRIFSFRTANLSLFKNTPSIIPY